MTPRAPLVDRPADLWPPGSASHAPAATIRQRAGRATIDEAYDRAGEHGPAICSATYLMNWDDLNVHAAAFREVADATGGYR